MLPTRELLWRKYIGSDLGANVDLKIFGAYFVILLFKKIAFALERGVIQTQL